MVFSILLSSPSHLLLPRKTPTTTILKQTPKPSPPIRCSASSLSSTPSLSTQFDLKTYWTTLIGEINKKLDEAIPVQYPEKIYEAMRYSVLAKAAKRAPPVMCVAACELFGGNRLAAFPTACALEMVHAASLIHDDLPCMDDDPSRRGKPSNHKIYGVDMAILAGDALFPLGFRHIVSHTPSDLVPEPRLLRVITEIARAVGSTGMAAGQFLDLEGEPNSVEFVQEKKFGEMGECSAVCGGLLAGAEDDELQRLRRYGRAVGVLYQVVDDVLEEKKRENEETMKKGKSYVGVYGVEKALEVAEELRAKAKKELDGFEKYVCGGLLAGAEDDELQRLRRYGKAVGVLYQVVDDVLEEKKRENEETRKKEKSYVGVYGVEKALEVVEELGSRPRRNWMGLRNMVRVWHLCIAL